MECVTGNSPVIAAQCQAWACSPVQIECHLNTTQGASCRAILLLSEMTRLLSQARPQFGCQPHPAVVW